MSEVWLRSNRRAMAFGCVPPLIFAALGIWLALGPWGQQSGLARWLGIGITLAGLGFVAALLRQIFRPRISYRDGQVLFHLQPGQPLAVPVSIVESFFVGQGPATLPGRMVNRQQSINLIARLSQRETEWARREVKPALGKWCDGYVTISGTWCEPLDDAVLRRLNRRLHEAKQQTAAS